MTPAPVANPHGQPVRQVCIVCLDTSATYKGLVPRGWRHIPGIGLVCRRCRVDGRARP